jgi:AcrR family transcriptional regulator
MFDEKQLEMARQFFAAAEPLMERYGFRKTTVEEICKAAGASKRTFYELFKDKSDLLMSMLVHMAADAVEDWHRDTDSDRSSLDKIHTYIDGYEAFGRAHPVFATCMHEAHEQGCDAEMMGHEKIQAMMEMLGAVLEEGVARGEFRPMDSRTMVWIIDSLLDSLYYVFPKMTGEKSALEDPVLARELRTCIIEGIRNHDSDIRRGQ